MRKARRSLAIVENYIGPKLAPHTLGYGNRIQNTLKTYAFKKKVIKKWLRTTFGHQLAPHTLG